MRLPDEAVTWWRWSRVLTGLVVLSVCVIAVACENDALPSSGAGRFFRVEATDLRTLEATGHIEDGVPYGIRATGPGTTLAGVRLKLVNPNALFVSLLVDEDAVSIEDDAGNRYAPLDPWERRQVAPAPLPDGATVLPLLWGPIEMAQGFEVEGWILFEIPKGRTPASLTWQQADFVKLLLAH